MKFPQVERDPMTNGVKGKSAIAVYEFLAEEADFEGDTVRAAIFKAQAKRLQNILPESVSDKYVNEAISKWGAR
jgi:hypothetical protein